MSRSAAAAVPAATILLIRDGPADLEVFMVERHHQIDFATGALVFPGGKVDPGDSAPAARSRSRTAGDLDDAAQAVRAAAIRETFEECGVLLARERGASALIGALRLGKLETRYRSDLQNGQIGIGDVAAREDLELACDLLVPFAHWITPEMMPKRFDTYFFLVEAPPDHVALHDGEESVDSVWTTVADAVAAESSGSRTIIFPTMAQLRKLGRSQTVADAFAAARSHPVVTVLPRIERNDAGRTMLYLPPEAGYDIVEAPVDSLR